MVDRAEDLFGGGSSRAGDRVFVGQYPAYLLPVDSQNPLYLGRPVALHGELGEPPFTTEDEVERLDYHALAAAPRKLGPPLDSCRFAGRVGYIHELVGSRQQQFGGVPADGRQRLHVPRVALVRVDMIF